ncbi:MAG: LacI family DNA-binding transcriptional regulator [Chloroflexi bacterium]|nr:LacI family DNA-binding transcriptional regulator [Chloroflexota bacterium]
MPVTIHDVAREAGLSINTISRALNGKPDVNAATRERVLATAHRLGYVPNQAARSMVTGRTGTVGLMVTDPANPIYARLLSGVEAVMRRAGYSLLLYNSGEDPAQEQAGVRSLRQSRVEGLLAVPAPGPPAGSTLAAAATELPVILMLRQVPDSPLDSAGWDNDAGARLAVQHLLALGHRAIGYVGQDLPVSSVRVRHAAYRAALVEASVSPRPEWEAHVRLAAAGAYTATGELLDRAPQLTALFVANDVLAPGVLAAVRRAGRRIPHDVSVVSFGDLDVAAYADPPLTTVHAPVREVATAAAERLLARIRQPELAAPGAPPWRFTAMPYLVVRESTGPAVTTTTPHLPGESP